MIENLTEVMIENLTEVSDKIEPANSNVADEAVMEATLAMIRGSFAAFRDFLGQLCLK